MEKSKLITYIMIMNKKLLCLVVALVAMFGCLGSMQAQNWKGSTPTAGGKYYLAVKVGDGSLRFLNESTGFDSEPKVLWEVGGNFPGNPDGSSSYTLTSGGGKTFSIYDNWGARISTSQTMNGDNIKLASNKQGNLYSICRYKKISSIVGNRNVVVSDNGGLSIGSEPTYCWLFISPDEAEAYVRYVTAFQKYKSVIGNVNNKGVFDFEVSKDNAEEKIQEINDLCSETSTFTNPILNVDAADPSVILGDDGYYYLFSSEHYAGEGIPLWQSADMVNWSKVTNVFPTGDRPSEVGYTFLWAPEIAKIGGKYVLYFANAAWGAEYNTQICVATSDKPYGPFKFEKVLFSATGENGTVNAGVDNCIDPSLFVDGDKKYMVWGSWHGIWYWELTENGLSVVGDKKALVKGTDGDWKKIEAPMIVKRDGYYYLVASKGRTAGTDNANDISYQLVVARSTSLGGTFENMDGQDSFSGSRATMSGLLSSSDWCRGPGHCSQIVTDKNGREWLFYHGYMKVNGAWDMQRGRVLFASPVLWGNWKEGWPGIMPPAQGDMIVKPAVEPVNNIYTRTGLAEGEYYTICLPYASAEKTGATFYSVNSVQKIDGEITGVYLDQLEDDEQLEKGVPYVFLADEETVTITCTGVPFVGYEGKALGLVGNLKAEKILVPEGKYFMNTANTIAMTTDKVKAKIAENRAYFDLNDVPEYSAAGAGAKTVFFGLSGSATGVDAVNVGNEMSGVVYNIMGQRVGAGAKGLLIKNGKKIFVKF